MSKVGVIGAGGGGAAATYVIDNATDADVTVFEKSRGVCGRAAARRREGTVYEYGANYLKDDDERVNELVTEEFDDGLVEVEGPIWTFDGDGNVSEGRDGDERRWTYEDGITRLAKHLFGATDATVERETRIEEVRRDDGWRLIDRGGNEHGTFDAVVVNPPAPQTAELLRDTGVEAVDRLGEAAARVPYRTVWTAVLGYSFEVDAPYYALINTDDGHDIGWLAREECKPGHVPDGESVIVVQASPDWSTRRYDAPAEENVAELAEKTAALVGDERLAEPDWTDHQGWRYALADDGVGGGLVQNAADEGVYVTGDWVAGEARLHAAVRNGLETGERVAYSL
ncbi:MAG: NAD(P)/FAD-dependent oxidoreductase [Halobacteriales archaeon]